MGGPDPDVLPVYFDSPAWHPGGEWIAAAHGDSIDADGDGLKDTAFGGIWLVHAETGRKQPLLAGFAASDWSADGKRLAMHRGGNIFTVDVTSLEPALVDSASLRQLTTEASNFYPSWSPDGQWITYDSNLSDPDGPYRVWKMRSDGSGKRDISGFSSRMPDWSPDGKHIVHKWYQVDNGEVAVMDSAGGDVRRLTFDNYSDIRPRFSPDGAQIAFMSEVPSGAGTLAAVFTINTDGTERKQISPGFSYGPDWSPDGRRLVFVRWGVNESYDFPGSGHLWMINADGTGLRQLTAFE